MRAVYVAAGTHYITFTATGKDSASVSYRMGVDRVDLAGTGTQGYPLGIPGESLANSLDNTTNLGPGAPASVQYNCCGVFWSRDHQEWLSPAATITLYRRPSRSRCRRAGRTTCPHS